METYNVCDVAEYIVVKCWDDKHLISNLQLQKILYILQKKWLQDYNSELFKEDFVAVKYGAVVPEVYWRYCGHGANPIIPHTALTYPEKRVLLNDNKEFVEVDKSIVDYNVEKLRELDPWEFESITAKGSAWDRIEPKSKDIAYAEKIPKEMIKKYG